MPRRFVASIAALFALALPAFAQQPPKPLSPDGAAQTQVLGKWVSGEKPAWTMGRQVYRGGKWIEITSGRPIARGRDVFGSGADYGRAATAVGAPNYPAAPVWRAGANVTTRLRTEAPLKFGDKTLPPGEYSVFIDLKLPEWTLIISSWAVQKEFDPNEKNALWGAYGYTPDKDVLRVPMKVEALPFDVDQLTWTFLDMKNDGGRLALMWGKTLGSVRFVAVAAEQHQGPGLSTGALRVTAMRREA